MLKKAGGYIRKEFNFMLSENEIDFYIKKDSISKNKNIARIGKKYYEGEHDIKNYKIFYYDKDGFLREDKTRSNVKISHPFFTQLVDQEVQYLLSDEENPFIISKDKLLQKKLNEYFFNDEDFCVEFSDLLTGAVSKGYDYIYAYKGNDNRTHFQYADCLNVVEVKSKEATDETEHIIYYFLDRYEDDIPIFKIEVWDKEQCYFYIKRGNKPIEFDESVEINPKPHITYEENENGEIYIDNYGTIPFFRLDNNRTKTSGLKPIKNIIDDYDMMACGLSNNIADANEYLVVVSGFEGDGDDMDALYKNLKTKKIIGVDSGGDVEYKTVSIPYEARKVKMEVDRENIFVFGMGFDPMKVGDGSNITNVLIKSRYALLDLKTNKFEKQVKKTIRKMLNIVLKEINEELGSNYSQNDVKIKFNREIITNATDNAQIELVKTQTKETKLNILLKAYEYITEDEFYKMLCELLEIEYNDKIREKTIDEIIKEYSE